MRALVAVIAMALVATLTALEASSVSANALGERIGSARRGQSYWESAMLQADRLVSRIDRGRDGVSRDLRRANRSFKKIKSRRAAASRILRGHAARQGERSNGDGSGQGDAVSDVSSHAR